MKILVVGANGFIGRHIVAEFVSHGHDVSGVARSTVDLAYAFPTVDFIPIDLEKATTADAWRAAVEGVDVVVNAAGLLRGPGMEAVHVAAPKALYSAAIAAGVRRGVLISAISARAEVDTDYSLSKLDGETVLRHSGLDWMILRPSLVYGDGSYGGTSLIRGLAGFPIFVPLPGNGDFAFTPIHVRDLARSVRLVCDESFQSGQVLEPVGPETLSLRELLARYRAWLGFGKVLFLPVPMMILNVLGRIGDFVGDGPIATNSLRQMVAGNAGDSAAFAEAVGFSPVSVEASLRDRPAQVQDRWHARLFFVAPLLQFVLIAMWLASAWLGLFHGEIQTGALVQQLGLPSVWADPLRIGSSALDIGIAAMLVFGRSHWRVTLLQLLVVAGYTLVIGLALPELWLDPLGPLLKNFPVMLAIAVFGVIGDKR